MINSPKVGITVIIIKDRQVLLGKRIGSHGANSWALPGGQLEFKESLSDCARREVFEETGLKIKNIKETFYTNDIYEKENKHYVTFFLISKYDSGKLEIKEPNKCLEWKWCDWNNLPKPLFVPLANLIKKGYSPFD